MREYWYTYSELCSGRHEKTPHSFFFFEKESSIERATYATLNAVRIYFF